MLRYRHRLVRHCKRVPLELTACEDHHAKYALSEMAFGLFFCARRLLSSPRCSWTAATIRDRGVRSASGLRHPGMCTGPASHTHSMTIRHPRPMATSQAARRNHCSRCTYYTTMRLVVVVAWPRHASQSKRSSPIILCVCVALHSSRVVNADSTTISCRWLLGLA